MNAVAGPVDLVLSGGGVLGAGEVGAVAVLEQAGAEVKRIAGTSAGSIVGSLLAANASAGELHQLLCTLEYKRFLDPDPADRVPVLGPIVSVLAENGWARGRYFHRWLSEQLEKRGVKTFADLEITDDPGADPRPEHRWRLTVMAADVTRGQLVRLPQDYELYGLDPAKQLVADAVRASMAVPYLFEPYKLRYPGGESLLVDGGLISNYPLDAFDRTDRQPPRWPTIGVTVIPPLPMADIHLLPELGALRLVPGMRYLESILMTGVVGRDQAYLAQPWVRDWSIQVDGLGVSPFDFSIGRPMAERLYESGQRAATEFLAHHARPLAHDQLTRGHDPQPAAKP